MNRFLTLAFACFCSLAAPFSAMSEPVVVELYSSQGCSSCPPADALLGDLAERDDVIALGLHVDYWDYLGWKDEFAQAAFTVRQKEYAHAVGKTMVYTPQMIIGGTNRVVGTRAMKVLGHVERQQKIERVVSLNASWKNDIVVIDAFTTGAAPESMVVQLVRYRPKEVIKITGGENAGKKITYHNIVELWEMIGEWSGDEPLNLKSPGKADMPHVVIIQDGTSGPILAAARVD